MSLYDSSFSASTPTSQQNNSMKSMLESRSMELFNLCDLEGKGFINKKDIQRVCNLEPGFTPEMLEEVYDSLDADGNGFLTLDEFTYGFTSLFQLENNDLDATSNFSSENNHQFSIEDDEEVENDFKNTMDHLGANELVKNTNSDIRELWERLRHDDPMMLKSFEGFIKNISQEMNQTKSDFNMLESALQNKSNAYDEHVRRLYEEMENQIKSEKNRIQGQEKLREKELKEKLESNLHEKELYLQESISKQIEMERTLNKLNTMEYQQKIENDRLQRENILLEERLLESNKHLEDSKSYISNLQTKTLTEKRNRVKNAWKNTETIAMERENLIKELEELRIHNKNLQDERDELELNSSSKSISSRRLSKRDSILSNYFPNYKLTPSFIEMDDEIDQKQEEAKSFKKLETAELDVFKSDESTLNITEHKPVEIYQKILNVPSNATPDRVFKIVFIGDSGVGKTSFVQRFCNDSFKESFNTTIGVDFQVKLLSIDGRIIALQLWDTAGQERYRSITKQYFRKADGIICMYDVTSEQSFKSLRNWITSIRECSTDDCLLTIIGNKIDLCENESQRVVKYKDGESLSKENDDCMFFEASSKRSNNIMESMEAIAKVLKEKEDIQIENVLNLNIKKEKKKGCCDF